MTLPSGRQFLLSLLLLLLLWSHLYVSIVIHAN